MENKSQEIRNTISTIRTSVGKYIETKTHWTINPDIDSQVNIEMFRMGGDLLRHEMRKKIVNFEWKSGRFCVAFKRDKNGMLTRMY